MMHFENIIINEWIIKEISENDKNISMYNDLKIKENVLFDCNYIVSEHNEFRRNLGFNARTNTKYAIYASTSDSLVIVSLLTPEKYCECITFRSIITSFDFGTNIKNEQYLIVGLSNGTIKICQILENKFDEISLLNINDFAIDFVSFHPRINNLCIIGLKGGQFSCKTILYHYKNEKILHEFVLYERYHFDHCCYDIKFEPLIGLIMGVAVKIHENIIIKLIDIKNNKILKEIKWNLKFEPSNILKLFWTKNNKLICYISYWTQSIFGIYDLDDLVNKYYTNDCNVDIDDDDDKNNDHDMFVIRDYNHEYRFIYYDYYDDLFYGLIRRNPQIIKIFKLTQKGIMEIISYKSNQKINAFDFQLKQFINNKKLQLIKGYKWNENGVLSSISFSISNQKQNKNVLDVYNQTIHFDIIIKTDKFDINKKYLSYKQMIQNQTNINNEDQEEKYQQSDNDKS